MLKGALFASVSLLNMNVASANLTEFNPLEVAQNSLPLMECETGPSPFVIIHNQQKKHKVVYQERINFQLTEMMLSDQVKGTDLLICEEGFFYYTPANVCAVWGCE